MLRQFTAWKMVPFMTHITANTVFCFVFDVGLAFRANKWHRFSTWEWGAKEERREKRGRLVKAKGKLGLGS